MIGAGVYISSSYALGALGDARLVLLAWLIGGVHATCGAVAYAALARRVKLSGGEYAFLARYVHPSVGLIAGWISLTAGFAAPVAAAAMILGEYLLADRGPTIESRCLASAWIALCALFHWINLRTGSWVNNAIVALKMIGFLVFAGVCLIFLSEMSESSKADLAFHESMLETSYLAKLSDSSLWMVMAVQLLFISLAYTGFNASIYLAEEIHDPQQLNNKGSADTPSKAVWQSMIVACVAVTIIYLGLNTLFLACSTPEKIIAGKDYFVSDVAFEVGGDWLQWVMRITIAISSATSVLAMTATGPRVIVRMAQDRWLPSKLIPKSGSPHAAIAIQAVASGVIVWLTSIKELIDYLGLTLTACGALATSTLWFAYREMNAIRPVRWWENLALSLYITGAFVLLYAAFQIKPWQFWLCTATFAIGIFVYLFSPKRR